jgi:hypothetical protein
MSTNNGPYRSGDITETKQSFIDEFIDKLIKIDASEFSYIKDEGSWRDGHIGLLYQSELKMFLIEWCDVMVKVEGWRLSVDIAQEKKLRAAYSKVKEQMINVAIQNVLEQVEGD